LSYIWLFVRAFSLGCCVLVFLVVSYSAIDVWKQLSEMIYHVSIGSLTHSQRYRTSRGFSAT